MIIISYKERVRQAAHRLWKEEGCPDGNQIINHWPYGKMKLSDFHWMKAKAILDCQDMIDKNIFACLDTQEKYNEYFIDADGDYIKYEA